MKDQNLPAYADFDDYTYSQRVAVVIRWFLLAAWMLAINYRPTVDYVLFTLDAMGLGVAVYNGYLHWRLINGRTITKKYVLALSAFDLTMITLGIGITDNRFNNMFFVFYYPAILGVAMVFPSRRIAFGTAALAALAYAAISIFLAPGVSYSTGEEKVLAVRIATMFGLVGAGNLMSRIERTRRVEAVNAERARAQENLELQRKAQEAEIAALQERGRIAREIHDGIAQSIYMLSLNLETLSEAADRDDGKVRDRIKELVPLAKQTLLETRHYIYDLKPVLAGERGLVDMAENQAREFRTVAGLPVEVSVSGEPKAAAPSVGAGMYRVMQEALANVFKHAGASTVAVGLAFEDGFVKLSVQDDGSGFNTDENGAGNGLSNMRERARELGGRCTILSAPGDGTLVTLTVPLKDQNEPEPQMPAEGRAT